MTIEIKEKFTVKFKRKEHPNAGKYPGRASQEFGYAFSMFLAELDTPSVDSLLDGTYVYDEELSAQFFDSVLEGDVLGVGLASGFDNHPAAYKFLILSIDREADKMLARNVTFENPKYPEYKGEERELTFEELSVALGTGFGEILMRDGKPFGVPEEEEMTINIVGRASGSSDSNAPSAPSAPASPVAALPEDAGNVTPEK